VRITKQISVISLDFNLVQPKLSFLHITMLCLMTMLNFESICFGAFRTNHDEYHKLIHFLHLKAMNRKTVTDQR